MDILGMLLDKYKVELSKSSIAELHSILIRKEYPKGMIIVDQGHICTDLYIISKGILRQFYYKNGRDISEHFSCEGDITFCIESLFMLKKAIKSDETGAIIDFKRVMVSTGSLMPVFEGKATKKNCNMLFDWVDNSGMSVSKMTQL